MFGWVGKEGREGKTLPLSYVGFVISKKKGERKRREGKNITESSFPKLELFGESQI